ncbi:hypothetical protein H840_0959 [Campylobacter jejuni subsp. jejuni ICDCCJ07002]|nr:hypothetical protein H840_0959 [Campylobacter jejuni subsp. jejuni ICDCCJ07002]
MPHSQTIWPKILDRCSSKGISESGGTSAIKGITITWAKR